MKENMKTKFGLGLLTGALFLCASLGAANLPQLRPENKNALGKLIGPNFLQKGTKVPRVLVFYRCEGFCHGDAIVTANEAFRLAAARTGAFTVKFSEDYEDLKAANLANFDVLVMNNTTNLKVKEHPYLADSLSTFTASGKGYVALHSGVDNFADCLILADMTVSSPAIRGARAARGRSSWTTRRTRSTPRSPPSRISSAATRSTRAARRPSIRPKSTRSCRSTSPTPPSPTARARTVPTARSIPFPG